jgi:hypothetical protein
MSHTAVSYRVSSINDPSLDGLRLIEEGIKGRV